MNPYEEVVEKLANGEIKEVYVERENVMVFIEIWRRREDRKLIVGEAVQGGNVNYRYNSDSL